MTNQDDELQEQFELSIVLPCLNEERTVGTCVKQARSFLEVCKVKGEVIVADNGSTDRSEEIARSAGAVVVPVEQRGYGSALKGGNQTFSASYAGVMAVDVRVILAS